MGADSAASPKRQRKKPAKVEVPDRPMRFAYADPPYIGQSKKHYSKEPTYAGEVDHDELIAELERDYPDGWALSLHEPSLHIILDICARHGLNLWDGSIRMGIWAKSFHIYKPNVNPSYGWEPVLFRGGRKRTRKQPTIRNFVVCPITLRKGLVGVKPDPVNEWILDWLNVKPGDVLDDKFPGSGGMGKCFEARLEKMLAEVEKAA